MHVQPDLRLEVAVLVCCFITKEELHTWICFSSCLCVTCYPNLIFFFSHKRLRSTAGDLVSARRGHCCNKELLPSQVHVLYRAVMPARRGGGLTIM
jgi:hypothetical protein